MGVRAARASVPPGVRPGPSLPGITGHNLLILLERRLDNVVYRLGFARTRPMARQLVTHGHIVVNDEKNTIPSYQVAVGETIMLRQAAGRSRWFRKN